jgi:hypothetical protein
LCVKSKQFYVQMSQFKNEVDWTTIFHNVTRERCALVQEISDAHIKNLIVIYKTEETIHYLLE